MRQILTLAIDDEPLALKLLVDYIAKTPFLKLVGEFDNPVDALGYLNEQAVDLVYLDIQMPDLTGIEFARALEKPPKLIFTTAFDKYAIEGYKLNAVDYLLKPFNYQEFLSATQKAFKQIELEQSANKPAEKQDDFLFLKSEYSLLRVNFDQIIYIEGLKDYLKVYTENEKKPILSLLTLKSLMEKLPEGKFMRVHRSYIVNLNKIKTIQRGRIVFGDRYIPVGEQYKSQFNEYVQKNFL